MRPHSVAREELANSPTISVGASDGDPGVEWWVRVVLDRQLHRLAHVGAIHPTEQGECQVYPTRHARGGDHLAALDNALFRVVRPELLQVVRSSSMRAALHISRTKRGPDTERRPFVMAA
jgi:hypothetical protein